MKVDRAKFLFLTTAIFACGTKNDPQQGQGVVAIPVQPPPTASMPPPANAKLAEPEPDAGKSQPIAAAEEDDEGPYDP